MKTSCRYSMLAVIALVCMPALLTAQDDAAKAKGLIAVLQSDASTFDKARACQNLAHLGDKDAVPALAAVLGDEKLAAYARCGLESISDPSAAAALRDAMGKLQGKCLAGVIHSIGVRRDVQAVAALTKLAQDRSSGAADEALAALGQIASPEAVAVLTQAIASNSAESRLAAAAACLTCAERLFAAEKRTEALSVLDAVRKADVPREFRNAATHDAIVAGQAAGLALFTEQLKSNDNAAFAVAMRASRRREGADATKALLAELDGLSPERKVLVIGALGDQRDREALPAIQKAAAASEPEVRLAAVEALGRLGDASSVPLLLDALASPDGKLAEAARDCLRTVEGQGVDDAILARLDQGSVKARVAVLETIAQRGVGSAAPAVLKLCDDPTPEIRDAAMRALGPMVELQGVSVAMKRLLEAKNADEAAGVKDSLAAVCARVIDKDGCARILSEGMAKAPAATQEALLDLLGKVGGKEALKVVAGHAKGQNAGLRDAALQALGNWTSVDAAPALLDLTKSLADNRLKVRCLRGYIRLARQMDLKPEERIAMCEAALQLATRGEEQKLVLEILPRIPSAKTLAVAVSQLGNAEVKDDAMSIAIAIAEKIVAAEPAAVAEAMKKVLAAGVGDAKAAQAKALLEKSAPKKGALFDGKTFEGWEGDTKKSFRIEDGAIVGGTMKEPIPRNEFLCTTRQYKNFVLKAEVKLVGETANSGMQIRSQRVPNSNEVAGFQADMDMPGGYWGCLYDEARRNRVLVKPDPALIQKTVKRDGWNQYEVRCEGARIQLFVNGTQTVDYTETDANIPQSGVIGLQIHGGGPSEAWFRNITIEELP